MGINLVVAVTDSDWYRDLSRRVPLEEVNFWSPNPKPFRALREGELFLFKSHAPDHKIVGGGIFVRAVTMPLSHAWRCFGVSNGAPDLETMRSRLQRYRRDISDSRQDFLIGCRIIAQPFFFSPEEALPAPRDWSPNIVSIKIYDTSETEGRRLWEALAPRLAATSSLPLPPPSEERFGRPVFLRPRLGQGAFRAVITELYERRCAITGERTLPVLEAAHIRPYASGGRHDPRNGLLLRSDLHNLFDTGYVTVTPEGRFEVSGRIRAEFENGHDYYALHGRRLRFPEDENARPDPTILSWHNEHVFRG